MKYYIYITFFVLLFSCTPTDEDVNILDTPIVESYLHPNQFAEVLVKNQIDYLNGDSTYTYVNGLSIQISNGEKIYDLNDIGNGQYQNKELIITEGEEYQLSFNYRNALVYSETYIPSTPQNFALSSTYIQAFKPSGGFPGSIPEPVLISFQNANAEYHYIGIKCIEENPRVIQDLDEDEDWPPLSFHLAPTKGEEERLTPMQFHYYGDHEVILYKVTAEFAALFENSDNSSINITDPPTNLENAFGIFSGINSDTLSLRVISL
ncbi:DUF4249 domain-containing protein [Flammeovirga yaeyamensis]|uniref:DUF4249 domain-containing protein n=1 Tax=Flammeovirga yaeyamensis TaxID=367791 RepID=A0AAX1N9Q5_9BACT|nr:DUF4249 family protein [Flammeovirga yaeyamensis]MBB3697552.1 hypothetical protein [Flammeovirga yaeyamensis]NMF36246.1 DUF4249 family protein [Flammeovirga yaeyamensis]QWG02975.1 DUF4249 domain-containing protein [Flammeovirga yaeyamensis]